MSASSGNWGSVPGTPVHGNQAAAQAPTDYAPEAETDALLKAGLQRLKQRLSAKDMLSVEDAAKAPGAPQSLGQDLIEKWPAIALSI